MFSIYSLRDELESINFLYLFDHVAHKKKNCIYCGQQFSQKEKRLRKTRDHVIPKVRISEASARFKSVFCQPLIVPACFDCNQVKGSKSLVEFRDYLKANWVRNRYLILSNLKKLIQ